MSDPIHILYVDDYPLDRELVRDALEKEHNGFRVTEASSRADFEARLAEGGFDLVLSDFNILGFEGLQVLDAVHARSPHVPVIIVTGTGSEEVAVEAMKRGAADYVIKTVRHIQRLPVTIHAALEKKWLEAERERAERVLRENEERYRQLFHRSPVGVIQYDPRLHIIECNERFAAILQANRENLVDLDMETLPDQSIVPALRQALQGDVSFYEGVYRAAVSSGEIWISVRTAPLFDQHGQVRGGIGIFEDVTERRRMEEALRASEGKYRTLVENIPQKIFIKDRSSVYVSCNQNYARDLSIEPDQCAGKTDYDFFPTELADKYRADDRRIMETGQTEDLEEIYLQDGQKVWIQITKTPIRQEDGTVIGVLGVFRDISARKRAEAEKERLQEQLNQAQKMESIGRLAGGIAHDFNNLLVSIIGYAELSLLKVAPDDQLYADLKRIRAAGERAAGLTRQILAFSRQQMLEMRPLELNLVIDEFVPMLRRLIGEDIDLQTYAATSSLHLKADKSQLEQVLLNLVVNARDAMPNGGRLTIETAHVLLDETYAAKHTEVQPGPHALLAVSDTGHGMDLATQQHIFEPFFTTKALGQGTGLGLATVFGIVKQHGGNIWVYSEPDKGSTFKIYLPLAEASEMSVRAERLPSGSLEGTETVLLVEDEASVRQLVGDTLRANGYQVLEAEEPENGLALAAHYSGQIHLLVTDVIMPNMNGRKLYQLLALERPEIKVLYMSGYTDNVIAHHHILDEESTFLQKPFTIQGLLQKVRATLEQTFG